MTFDPTTAKLVIYLDSQLLRQDDAGSVGVGSLKLERTVAGAPHSIYQSQGNTDFSDVNYFKWEEPSYKLGAFKDILDGGALKRVQTYAQPVLPGQMFDWTGLGRPLQYMPTAQSADDGCPWDGKSTSIFGTKGQPKGWRNTIEYSIDGSNSEIIYTEEPTYDESDPLYRAFSVPDITFYFTVSWAFERLEAGTGNLTFPIRLADGQRYLSWGYDTSNSSLTWYDYGITDPGRHDPSKLLSPTQPSDPPIEPLKPVPTGPENEGFGGEEEFTENDGFLTDNEEHNAEARRAYNEYQSALKAVRKVTGKTAADKKRLAFRDSAKTNGIKA